MKKIIMTLAAVLCCAVTITLLTACGNKKNAAMTDTQVDSTALIINLDSIVIKPYMAFGSSLADVEKYMNENYADWEVQNPDTLDLLESKDGNLWGRYYTKGKLKMGFHFNDADATNLTIVSHDFYFPMSLEPVMAELERLGFENRGELKYDDFNADIVYMYLSADEKYEVQVCSWKKDGGSWAISFQPTDEKDFKYLVNKQ